jgi:hypothetical protein
VRTGQPEGNPARRLKLGRASALGPPTTQRSAPPSPGG